MFSSTSRVNFNYGFHIQRQLYKHSRFDKRLAVTLKTNREVVNLMVGYLFVLYKGDKARKKV